MSIRVLVFNGGSGLGDKLIDLILLSTLGKSHNKNIKISSNTFGVTDTGYHKYSKHRPFDIQIEMLTKYLFLPHNIIIDDLDQNIEIYNNCAVVTQNENENYFADILGGIRCLRKFYLKYCQHISFNTFIELYRETLSEFKFKPQNITIPNKIVGIHLRRTDKLSETQEFGKLLKSEIGTVNEKTKNAIKSLRKTYENFFLCSDDENAINLYKAFIEDELKGKVFVNDQTLVGDTSYLDMFWLSNCDTIIMSCKSSNFSLFSALIGKRNIQYLYDSHLVNMYSDIINIKYIKCSVLHNNVVSNYVLESSCEYQFPFNSKIVLQLKEGDAVNIKID